jgi:hypothetical protein
METSWALLDVIAEPTEVLDGIVDAPAQLEPSIRVVSEGFLEEAEETLCSWDGYCQLAVAIF